MPCQCVICNLHQHKIVVYLSVSINIMFLENIASVARPITIDIRVVLNLVHEVTVEECVSNIIANIDKRKGDLPAAIISPPPSITPHSPESPVNNVYSTNI